MPTNEIARSDQDIILHWQDDVFVGIQCFTLDQQRAEVDLDLTGVGVQWRVGPSLHSIDSQMSIEKVTADISIGDVGGGTNNLLRIPLIPADTQALKAWRQYYHQLRLTVNSSSKVTSSGKFTLLGTQAQQAT